MDRAPALLVPGKGSSADLLVRTLHPRNESCYFRYCIQNGEHVKPSLEKGVIEGT